MTGSLNGKVAIVTGGASGIGKATVELFVAEGARVVIADLQEEQGEALASSLGDTVSFKHTNVAQPDSVDDVVNFAVDTYGDLDIMYNNAGVSGAEGSSRFLDNDLATFEKVMAVDLLGPMLGARAAGRYMVEQGKGVILNTASIGGSHPGYGVPDYRAAKAGVIAFTRSLAIELGPSGVRVNSISPGPTKTEMIAMDVEMSEEIKDKILNASIDAMIGMQVLKQVGEARDIAEAALFLASDRARQITGIDLVVDAGASLGDTVNRQAAMEEAFAGILQGQA